MKPHRPCNHRPPRPCATPSDHDRGAVSVPGWVPAATARALRAPARIMAADRRPKPCAACAINTSAPVLHLVMRCGAAPMLLLVGLCPTCTALLQSELGRPVQAAIERTLNSAEFSEPIEGPNGVQAFTWRAA